MSNAEAIEITVDGVLVKVNADQKVTQIFASQAVDRTAVGANAIVLCKINGELKDLWLSLIHI
jgi:hypothetical protein